MVAKIEKDIERKGGANVPIGVIREVFSEDTPVSIEIEAVLEEFASNHGWHYRHEALPCPRVMFYPIEGAGKLPEKKEE